jgi:hypothetical protein
VTFRPVTVWWSTLLSVKFTSQELFQDSQQVLVLEDRDYTLYDWGTFGS